MSSPLPTRWLPVVGLPGLLLPLLCLAPRSADDGATPGDAASPEAHDPLALALASAGRIANPEAVVPPACYTDTSGGTSNPCWVCHTVGQAPNDLVDTDLQREYAFSDAALENHWRGLFVDRSARMAEWSEAEMLAWVRQDNYTPLREALAARPDFPGYHPDLDLAAGFDEQGFARDGSHWRALRYKPFPGTFWPTNGSVDDVFVRLPAAFREVDGAPVREVHRANLSILEAAVAADPRLPSDRLDFPVEPLDEEVLGVDLDGDGEVRGTATVLRALPRHYLGDARDVPVHRGLHPQGVEYLHTVRYLDPDAPTLHATRLKELRWSTKQQWVDPDAVLDVYVIESEEKLAGVLPFFPGGPDVGLSNGFGWRLQGFIEDARGRLRLQTHEEHLACMGCHSSLGVTVDQTFTLARKVPGADGWRYQDLAGMPDAPQLGHDRPEVLTYLERVGGGDEFRANAEMRARFFDADGALREAEVRRAAPGGDRDLRHLVVPSRARALELDRAYRALVEEQAFALGRDTVPVPPRNVFERIENGSTELGATGHVFRDGRLGLDWAWRPTAAAEGPAAEGAASPGTRPAEAAARRAGGDR